MDTPEDRIVGTTDSQDRRQTYRMAKPKSQCNAKIKLGKRKFDVEVLDESAGGYLISGFRLPVTNLMETVELFNYQGAHCLRVAWRRNIDGRTHMGLQRQGYMPEQSESPWLVWLVAAIVFGIGLGLLFATRNNPYIMHQLHNSRHTITNTILNSVSK